MITVRQQLLSGFFYSAVAKYSGIIVSLVVTGVLARLITPSEFGIVAIATVIITFFGIFSELGLAPAIIQYKTLTTSNLSDIFSFTVWIGIVVTLCFFLLSWAIASYYSTPILGVICRILSINLFFATINIVPNALLLKEKRFRFIAFRSLVVQIVCGIIAVGVALSGFGLYALTVNPVLSSIILFVINIRKMPQRLTLTTGIKAVQQISDYAAYQFLFNTLNYFTRNLDKLLVGKHLGMSALGFYEKSYRLVLLPLQNITHVITPVMHPVFSEYQDNSVKLATYYEKIVKPLAFIGFPLTVFLYFTAEEIILIVFGSQWMPSIPIFKILSLTAGIQILLSTSGTIFQAAGDTKNMFRCGLFSATTNITAMFIGVFVYNSLLVLAICINLSFYVNFIQCYLVLYKVTLRTAIAPFWKLFISPLLLSGLTAVLLFLFSWFTPYLAFWISFIVKTIIAGSTVILYIQLTGIYNFRHYFSCTK